VAANGMSALQIEPATGACAVVFTPSTEEPRSSSAMAEYRTDGHATVSAGLPHSVSSPSLTILSQQQQQHQLSPAVSQPNVSLRSLLPAYRAAPDYETAVRIKYGEDIAQLLLNPAPAPVQQPQPVVNMYKPPPPYPYGKVSSTSTPDLPGSTASAAPEGPQQPLTLLRNGEPIYQNIPLRQPGSQNSLQSASNTPPPAQSSGQTRRKWGLPVRSSARSAVINRVQQQPSSPSSSPSSKRSLESGSPASLHQPVAAAGMSIKDHLVNI